MQQVGIGVLRLGLVDDVGDGGVEDLQHVVPRQMGADTHADVAHKHLAAAEGEGRRDPTHACR